MKNTQISIHWNEAEQMETNAKAEKEKRAVKYRKNIRRAKNEFNARLGSENFSLTDFYDSAYMFGIESDELLNELI